MDVTDFAKFAYPQKSLVRFKAQMQLLKPLFTPQNSTDLDRPAPNSASAHILDYPLFQSVATTLLDSPQYGQLCDLACLEICPLPPTEHIKGAKEAATTYACYPPQAQLAVAEAVATVLATIYQQLLERRQDPLIQQLNSLLEP